MALQFKKLKRGIYTSPQHGEVEIERYVIENEADLKAFAKAFPQIKNRVANMYENVKRDLTEGRIIIATDEHPMSGFPTYSFEDTSEDTHPCSMYRKRLCTNQ